MEYSDCLVVITEKEGEEGEKQSAAAE